MGRRIKFSLGRRVVVDGVLDLPKNWTCKMKLAAR